MPIRIMLADDHKLVRDGLRSLLEKQSGMAVIAEADNGREAVRLALQVKPDIIIMDIAMPELNGIEAMRQIVANAPATKILSLSMHSDKSFISRALGAGALGYMLKDCAFDEMVHAIHTIVSDKVYLSPQIAGTVVEDYVGRLRKDSKVDTSPLTPRELEVLQLLAEGKSTKEIASALGISIKTVETYRSQIMDKLDIHSVAELTKFAIREGITSLEP